MADDGIAQTKGCDWRSLFLSGSVQQGCPHRGRVFRSINIRDSTLEQVPNEPHAQRHRFDAARLIGRGPYYEEAKVKQLTRLAPEGGTSERRANTTVSVDGAAEGFPAGFQYKPDLAWAATSRELKAAPRHNWFYFPHSYSYRLVNEILDHWNFPQNGTLADNFSGSGTTLLTARQRGLFALGFDLSPLAVTVAKAKVASYKTGQLNREMDKILAHPTGEVPHVAGRLSKAFTKEELQELFKLLVPIAGMQNGVARRFFLVAFLWTARMFSRAVPDGGWFRWKEWPDRSNEVGQAFERRISCMIADVDAVNWLSDVPVPKARLADARKLPVRAETVDGLITSPPYPNRHDYSRVFHIDLLLLGLPEAKVTKLRRESIRSHVEARSPNGYKRRLKNYGGCESITSVLAELPPDSDPRIEQMLKGYFEDIYLSLLEVHRVLRLGGRAAYVVGNVRHAGVMIPVDKITAELASQVGLSFDVAWVLRLRGNSAQQMGLYGKEQSRETVIILSKGSS